MGRGWDSPTGPGRRWCQPAQRPIPPGRRAPIGRPIGASCRRPRGQIPPIGCFQSNQASSRCQGESGTRGRRELSGSTETRGSAAVDYYWNDKGRSLADRLGRLGAEGCHTRRTSHGTSSRPEARRPTCTKIQSFSELQESSLPSQKERLHPATRPGHRTSIGQTRSRPGGGRWTGRTRKRNARGRGGVVCRHAVDGAGAVRTGGNAGGRVGGVRSSSGTHTARSGAVGERPRGRWH